MGINILMPFQSRQGVKSAIEAWHAGRALTPEEQDHVDLALRCNAAELEANTLSPSDRFESQTIEVGA